MDFTWLKRYMPRSLYARAALILLVPVLTIQAVVSVVFVQRLYEDVTQQMTRNVLLDVSYLVDEVRDAPNREAALDRVSHLTDPLALDVNFRRAVPKTDERLWIDLSGRVVIATLRDDLDGVRAVDLASSLRRVEVFVETPHGLMEVGFDRRRVSASNPHQLLVLMAFTSMLMTIVAYLFLRNQLRPVQRLAEAAEAFGRGRHAPFRPGGATEMRAAGNAFLEMRARIERMIEQRTMMLSGVSHDLRTPLTRLKLALSLGEETPETRAMQKDVADMERLLDTLLDFVRSDAMEERARVDPAQVLRNVAERSRRSGKHVDIDGVEDAHTVLASPIALDRAIENLVSNAVRYGTRALLSFSMGEKSVRFTIEDDGPGIPAELRQEAIKPFARLDSARNQNRGPGVGLGLAIANDIARRHGGSLRLGESQRLGGLRVDLVLPS